MLKIFEEKIERNLDTALLIAPDEEWVADGGIGGPIDEYGSPPNQEYLDMRGCDWSMVTNALAYEFDRVEETIPLNAEESQRMFDERYDDDYEVFSGLDLGVASTVFALSAVGCIPFTSCNGGCFGNHHREDYPLVIFYALPKHASLLIEAAEKSGVGLDRSGLGTMVYSGDIRDIMKFASALLDCSSDSRNT